ncbi:MAG: putative lipoic acid-binding regulatory protein [Pseudohongiellaceae bacterium]|jgi:putative lipoic acid-binding regulatory protein
MTAPQRPEITYPCSWGYRLIGRQSLEVRAAVATIVGDQPYELIDSHTSSKGKYHSLGLTLTVSSEAERLSLFSRLSENSDILFVL